MEIDHRLKGVLQPDGVLDHRREPRVRGNHLVPPFDVAQDKMRQHRRPYLPFDNVLLAWENVVSFTASTPRMRRSSPGEYRREVDEFIQGEDMGKLAEHQQVHLRGVGKLPGLDFLFGREFRDFVSWQVALDYLRQNWYHSLRSCLKCFFHGIVYGTREGDLKATTFLLTSHHRYCMVVIGSDICS